MRQSCRIHGVLGENVEIVQQPARKKDRLWPVRLAAILRDHSVDILHVRGLTLLPDSLLAARFCGDVAVAFSFHGFERVGRRFGAVRRRVYRAAVARCDDRWAVGHAAAEAVADELRLAPEQFGILPNGVDTRHYMPAACRGAVRRRLGLPQDGTIILSVGNLKPIKGHDVLLEAMSGLRGAAARATLVVAGGDYLDGALHGWAREHLSDFDVRFVGEQTDTVPWYQAADLFVLPSRWEGLSNALLEAMSCGLPVIATAVGGNLDVVEQGRTGLLVAPDALAELRAAIQRLVTDTRLRSALAVAGRTHVHEQFSAPIAADRYARRYVGLARRARGGRGASAD